MNYLFLILLAIALINGYISQRSDGEIIYLTRIIAIGCLIASLVLAPWQLQLILLVIVVVAIRQFWQTGETQQALEVIQSKDLNNNLQKGISLHNESEKVIRTYRGVTYVETPSSTTAESKKSLGKYRGNFWKITKNQKSEPSSRPVLKYRGAIINPEDDSVK